MSILVSYAEKGLMIVKDLDFKMNVGIIIGVRDKDIK